MSIPLELLAPAKTAVSGMAAIDHGADAVYIGAPRFGARADAGNDMAAIARLIRHAHRYYARVYIALNTILTDAELPQARDIIHKVHDMGADGLIIQDVGLLEIDLPPIPLIASTQMHNDAPEKVKFLEAVGFSRVILARELSLEEIAAIRRETTVELEAFVHGALCVSYSGQCYMSQAVAGRSGNRGVCAQPCRGRYTLTDGDGKSIANRKFLLSLKDLNLLARIPDLVAAGITSFKIEGRLKEIDYVKNVVAAYRTALDRIIADQPTFCRSSSGRSEITFLPDLERTFNRGYTDYFIDGRKEKVASLDTQKSIGQPIGRVIETGPDFFRTDGMNLENGDGLCFFTRDKKLTGLRVNQVRAGRIFPNSMKGLKVGSRLFRNHDQAFSRELKKNSARRQIALRIHLFQNADGVVIEAVDEDGIRSQLAETIEFAPANHPDRMKTQIITHLSRTGNTPYCVTRVQIDPDEPGFIPLSTLNSIRRTLLDRHTQSRSDARPSGGVRHAPTTVPYPESNLTFTANVLNAKARRFYQRHGVRQIEAAFETLDDKIGKTVMTTRYCVRYQLDACLERRHHQKTVKPPLRIDDGRHRYRLEFDCQRCRMRVVLEGRCGRKNSTS